MDVYVSSGATVVVEEGGTMQHLLSPGSPLDWGQYGGFFTWAQYEPDALQHTKI